METYKIIEKLRNMYNILCDGEGGIIEIEYFNYAADRLEELEKENSELKQQLSQQQPEWISVEDGKEMPDAFSYTGIRHNQFPRLVVAIDENSHITHWMMLDAPKPKRLTFRDVFLEKFPNGLIELIQEKTCVNYFFRQFDAGNLICVDCDACWNQPYFEAEEGESGE